MAAAIDELKEHGVWISTADMDGQPWCSVDYTGPAAVVVGSEGFGGIFGLILVICGVISGIFGLLCSDGNTKASAVDDAEKSIQPDSSNESTPDSGK